MTIVSSAQNFEDVLLWRALKQVERGTYLDIGAQDPVVDSVSLAFYQAGWRGVHVEAVPAYADALRAARPDERVIQAVVSDRPGEAQFHEIAGTGISTGRPEIAAKHAAAGYEVRTITVPSISLDDLLDQFAGDVHWLKVDVEGMEADVLRSWKDHPKRPWILVIEATSPGTQEPTEQDWIDEVLGRGYSEVLFDGLSRYFVHETQAALKDRFGSTPNIFDDFTVAPHHFAASAIRRDLVDLKERLDGAVYVAEEQRGIAQAAEAAHRRALEELVAAERARHAEVHEILAERKRTERDLTAKMVEQDYQLRVASAGAAGLRAEVSQLQERASALQLRAEEAEALHRQLQDEARAAQQAAAEQLRAALVEAARLQERSEQLQVQVEQGASREAELRQATEAAAAAHQSAMEQATAAHRSAMEQASAAHRSAMEQATAAHQSAFQQAREAAASEQSRLQAEIASQREIIAEADAIIASARSERLDPWRRLGLFLRLSKPGPGWRALNRWPPPAHRSPATSSIANHHVAEGSAEAMHYQGQFEPRQPSARSNSLAELQSLPDGDFIRSAYITLLGRDADEGGEIYYIRRLRSGHSRLAILSELRTSEEGRRHDPGIAGLDRALRRARRERMRIFGGLFRFLSRNHWEAPGNQINRAIFENSLRLERRVVQVEQRLSTVDIEESLRKLDFVANSLTSGLSKRAVSVQAAAPAPVEAKKVRPAPILERAQNIRLQWLGR